MTKVMLALVAASVLLLTGCVTVTPAPKPGLSDAEVTSLLQQQLQQMSSAAGKPVGEEPPVSAVTVVQPSEYGTAFATCMNDAGFTNYSGNGDSYTVRVLDASAPDDQSTVLECTSLVQVDPRSYALNAAQLDFLYDYFQRSLIPCLELAGYNIAGVPMRSELGSGWNPYFLLAGDAGFTLNNPVVKRCPPVPHGLEFGGKTY